MATVIVDYAVTITDVLGNTATTRVLSEGVPDTTLTSALATNAASIATAVAACTNGKVTQVGYSVITSKAQISASTAPPPANATYPSVTDGARLQFANSTGARRSLTIPAPLLTDFKTNSNVVNPADANIGALITVIEGLGLAPDVTNLYEGGAKVGGSARRRQTHKSL